MRYRFLALSAVVVTWSLAQACGGDDSTTQDSGPDVTTNDTGTGNDTGTTDTGTGNDTGTGDAGNDTGTNPDTGTTGIAYQCPDGGAATDCSQCGAAATEPCVYCGTADASVLIGRCVALGTGCTQAPNNFDICNCGNNTAHDAGLCPAPFQVCRQQGGNNYDCRTCGDSPLDNGLTCKGGGSCNTLDGGCK